MRVMWVLSEINDAFVKKMSRRRENLEGFPKETAVPGRWGDHTSSTIQ
jgi:hypothetical protein